MANPEGGKRPGLAAMLRSVVAAPFEERVLRETRAKHDRLQFEAANAVLQEIVQRVTPEDDGYLPIGGVGQRELDDTTATSLREAAQRAALENTHAVGYLESLRRFVVGRGATITVEHDSDDVAAAADRWLAEFRRWNNWDRLEDEIPGRTWRDGETFIRRFDAAPEPEVTDIVARRLAALGTSVEELRPAKPPEGMVFVRLVPAEQIADPQAQITHGIITAKDDVQTVLGYCWCPDGKTLKEVVPADQMLHVKARVDSDVKRGRSLLEPLLKRLRQHEDWLNYRITLNLMRTAVVLVKTVTGSPGQIAGIRDAQQKEREDKPGSTRNLKMLKPGTTVHASPGVSYEFKNPQIQAMDAKEDGRAILLTLAAATGLPEYMFTGDSSNSNFASTMVSEAPAVREFESWQDFFTPAFVLPHRWALVAGARAGQIEGMSEEDATTAEIKVAWPPMLSRNELDHANVNKVRRDAGVLSQEGMARDEGIDWTVEKERLQGEAEDPPKLPITVLLKDLAAAMMAGLLTPDEGLENKVRAGLGFPNLVGEERDDLDPNNPALPPLPPIRRPQDEPPTPVPPEAHQLVHTKDGRLVIEVGPAPVPPKPKAGPRRLRISEVHRDTDGRIGGATVELDEDHGAG